MIHPFYYPSSQSAASQPVSPTSQTSSKSAEIPPSSNNSIPSMLTNILALCQLSGKNIQSEGTDQDGLSLEGETDLEISEENDILVHITFVCGHCELKLLTTFKCQCYGNNGPYIQFKSDQCCYNTGTTMGGPYDQEPLTPVAWPINFNY